MKKKTGYFWNPFSCFDMWLCINIDTFSPFCKGLGYSIDAFKGDVFNTKPEPP